MIEEEEVEAGDDGDFSLFGESFVDDEETPWLILRAFFPFFDDEEDVDMEEFLPCDDEPASGVEDKLRPELSFGDFEGEETAVVSSSSVECSGFELGSGLKAGIVLIAFLFWKIDFVLE